jgi:hypothetical protein
MIVAPFNLGIDALHFDLRVHRRTFRMFPIDFDPAAKVGELPASGDEKLMHTETNRRSRWLELVRFPS